MEKFYKIIAIIFLVVSLIGFTDATYLAVEHYRGEIPPCGIQGCEKVTTSEYSTFLGIPVALFGSLYYLLFFLMSVVFFDTKNKKFLRILSSLSPIGFLMSIYFLVLQLFVIKAICLYCMLSVTTSTILFITGMIYLFRKKHS